MAPKEEEDAEVSKLGFLGEKKSLLLQPSPNSTNRPSMSNLLEYGSLVALDSETDDAEESLIQMHNNQNPVVAGEGSFGEDAWPPHAKSFKAEKERHLFLVLLAVASLLILSTVGVLCYSNVSHRQNHSAQQPHHSSSNSIHERHGYISRALRPFSTKHPVTDLKVKPFTRPEFSSPNPELFSSNQPRDPLPTNSWYQNLILAREEPTQEQRVYPIPYVVDVVGPIPGIRVHHPTVVASATVIQLTQVLEHGLTLGAASRQSILSGGKDLSKKYKIANMTPLGITLEWTDDTTQVETDLGAPLTYSSSIVRGMPYATMQYSSNQQQQPTTMNQDVTTDNRVLPSVASETPIGAAPILDGITKLNCDQEPQWVQREIQLEFTEPDYTWLIFVSRPVRVQCIVPPPSADQPEFVPGLPVPSPGIVFALQFLEEDNANDGRTDDLVVRMALANDCTHGVNPSTCGRLQTHSNDKDDPLAFANLLRRHATHYPGPETDITFDFEQDGTTRMRFNWNAQSLKSDSEEIGATNKATTEDSVGDATAEKRQMVDASEETGLLMYALPHHQDLIREAVHNSQQYRSTQPLFPTHNVSGVRSDDDRFCKMSLLGPACLAQGSTWDLQEDRQWETSFRAPRPPENDTLPALVQAYQQDLSFELPSYFQRGAGDTYFSGKMLAKLGRILTIGEELYEVCNPDDQDSRPEECAGLEIPSPNDAVFKDALARLRSSVEVWINGTADTPFVYDDEWGGMVSCGCIFAPDQGACRNAFPNCPAFYDPGLDFGNAWYNDHHFHLGYHIYAASAVAHFDPQWGRDHFEQVLLLIRDIANPSHDDVFFPMSRNKDWYQGSSWASGIAVTPLNGRNQESSSEAIAAYEGVALYGMEMVNAWKDHDEANFQVAHDIQSYGEILMASEVRSADRYWHVVEASKRRQYPAQYTPHVIGIMWTTMAQFQTWFGNAAYLAYGIQLLPLTAVSEKRDAPEWVRELYGSFAESCDAHSEDCRDQGWSVLVLAMLATVGHRDEAIRKALELPVEAFTSAGGNGHSLTNTLWYLATRSRVDDPLVIEAKNDDDNDETAELEQDMYPQWENPGDEVNGQSPEAVPPVAINPNFNCSCPETCNEAALNRFAVGHSCRDRIVWLMTQKDHSEWDACHQVGLEFPEHCAACDPRVCSAEEEVHSQDCPPCSKEVCAGELNKCPTQSAPFLCTQGPSVGGCARSPWILDEAICEGCCELSLGCGE